MLQLPRWRVILVILSTLFGVLFTLPNLVPASTLRQIPAWLPHQTLNLGLDLRGGSYLLLEVDVNSLRARQLDSYAEQMASSLRGAQPAIRYTGRGVAADAARIRLIDPNDMQRAMRVLRPMAQSNSGGADILTFTTAPDGQIEARLTPQGLTELSRSSAQQSIDVIRRRIDPNGTSEVSIVRQGDARIVVQAPGVDDPESLKRLIGQTALMTFNLVPQLGSDVTAATLPIGVIVAPPYPGVGNEAVPVQRRAEFTGDQLEHASVQADQQGRGGFVLAFRLKSRGTTLFCRITREHTHERFAILLDNQVLTAPNINEPICGGSGQIEGNFTAQSAGDLARMLNAGALPAPLNVIEQRTVGASLGQAAIDAGSKSGRYATIAVVLFMVLAYGLFGGFACLALVINVAMIIGAMSVGGATLSLPGIAGLVLTIGMAVDANVLIYERMREEQANGRGPALAIDAGFSRALVTIIDSHLTQIGVAFILFVFGEGPVKGFAWTLSIGVVTSVITATVVTQYFIWVWFKLARPKKLPI